MIDASVYAEGTGNLAKLPRILAYAGVRVFAFSVNSTGYVVTVVYSYAIGHLYSQGILHYYFLH